MSSIETYIWKGMKVASDKNTYTQVVKRMVDMTDEELKTAYQHCKDMLYNDNSEHPGRYLVLDEISQQIQNCNAELAVRWFLSKTSENGTPIYTRFSIISELQEFLQTNNLENVKLSNIKLKDIYSGLPANYANINLDLFLRACKELLGKFNRSHLTPTFIINIGLWFSPEEIKNFEMVERLTTMEERINTVKERLNLKPETKIPMKSTGLNYTQFRNMINLKSNKKYTELTTVQLETLRDRVLFLLEDNVKFHISKWETLMSQLQEVSKVRELNI